jgi:hypothetical protein
MTRFLIDAARIYCSLSKMADETMTETNATTEALAVAPAEKKTRKPRAPKAAAKIATSDFTASPAEQPVKNTRSKRGSKIAPVTAEKAAVEPKKVATRTPRAKAAAPAPVAPSMTSPT